MSGQLEIDSGKAIDTLTITSPAAGNFKAQNDGHGGTEIVLKTVNPGSQDHSKQAASTSIEDHGRDAHLDFHSEIAHHDFML